MNDIIFPDAVRDELKEWLEPVGRGTDDYIDQMQAWAAKSGDKPLINQYTCQNGHDWTSIDRADHDQVRTIDCPICGQEARSHFYFCDQTQKPFYEFYQPSDPLAHDKANRGAIRNGAVLMKKVLEAEPVRFGKKIKSSIKAMPKIVKDKVKSTAKKSAK